MIIQETHSLLGRADDELANANSKNLVTASPDGDDHPVNYQWHSSFVSTTTSIEI